MKIWLTSALALLVLPGCADDTTGVGGSGAGGGSTTAATTTTGAATTTVGTTTNAVSSSTGMAVCPPDAADGACLACSKDSCCDATVACLADTACTTCLTCVDAGGSGEQCVQNGDCDLSNPATAEVYQCTVASCSTECYQGGFDCTPAANDSICVACTKANCCAEATTCYESATCATCIQCVQDTGDPFGCANGGQCQLGDPATTGIFQCTQANCNAECLN